MAWLPECRVEILLLLRNNESPLVFNLFLILPFAWGDIYSVSSLCLNGAKRKAVWVTPAFGVWPSWWQLCMKFQRVDLMWCVGRQGSACWQLVGRFVVCNPGRRMQEIQVHTHVGPPAPDIFLQNILELWIQVRGSKQTRLKVYMNSIPMFNKLVRVQVLNFI